MKSKAYPGTESQEEESNDKSRPGFEKKSRWGRAKSHMSGNLGDHNGKESERWHKVRLIYEETDLRALNLKPFTAPKLKARKKK